MNLHHYWKDCYNFASEKEDVAEILRKDNDTASSMPDKCK